jgi:hypothetical protein
VVLLAVGLVQFGGRPHGGEDAAMPKWMGALDSFDPLETTQ